MFLGISLDIKQWMNKWPRDGIFLADEECVKGCYIEAKSKQVTYTGIAGSFRCLNYRNSMSKQERHNKKYRG
jgi:hypothetical protein